MKRPEQTFHQQVAYFLMLALGYPAWFTTFPAGGGGVQRGRILQSVGLKRGCPDILVIDAGRAIWLELKAKRGRLSEAQIECHAVLRRAGSAVHVCKTLDEVIAALNSAGVPLRIASDKAGISQ